MPLEITESKTSMQAEPRDNTRGNVQDSRGNILPKAYFLSHLRIEKRRVDRSKAPLSIALFLFDNGSNATSPIEEFLASLEKNTRETDIKGWVDHNVIGVILPDTDEKGVQNCVK